MALLGAGLRYWVAVEGTEVVIAPTYYTRGGIECFDVIDAWGLNYYMGCALKYIARCGFKDGADSVSDLEKAVSYLTREIERVKKSKG